MVHAVFLERAGARADADDLLERVMRRRPGLSVSPGRRLALSATVSADACLVICGRTPGATSVWKQSA